MSASDAAGHSAETQGLSLAPFRALRYAVPEQRLGRLLCPPYDVIDDAERAQLLDIDPDNAVALILPRAQVRPPGEPGAESAADPYQGAAARLETWISDGLMSLDGSPAIYVYEMRSSDGSVTRGLIGAVELRVAEDGVILPHENTMAGPVADRLALMTATQANLEPIYLVYDGGGAASDLVGDVKDDDVIARTTTPDGTDHRLWAITDPATLAAVADDLGRRRALIADGHHRYATYLELQRQKRAEIGDGPWDRGLALLVDSSSYGPQVHAIHRVLPTLPLARALAAVAGKARITDVSGPQQGLADALEVEGFAAVLTDGDRTVLLHDLDGSLMLGVLAPGEPAALGELDVTVLHRGLAGPVWGLADNEDSVGYAHSEQEAITAARSAGGTAVLLRPTPVAAVAAVAAAGARMPRKSTLFTPKPASGLVIRRFADQSPE
jgi:uncharacterized protein (DUF1015 family)